MYDSCVDTSSSQAKADITNLQHPLPLISNVTLKSFSMQHSRWLLPGKKYLMCVCVKHYYYYYYYYHYY